MDYLFAKFSKIEELLNNNFIFLFLDYDGTLTPIVQTPEKAIIQEGRRELIRKLSKSLDCKLAIISGRSLQDLKSIIGVDGIIYVGNHGLEIEGPKIRFESQVSPQSKSIIRNITVDMKNRLSGIKGVLIEDKGLTLSIHYRLVSNEDMPAFEKVIYGVTNPHIESNMIKMNAGKKVYEIKPPVQWDKGKVSLWLLARQQFISQGKTVLAVYIGDDITDEDAFKALKDKGLTVFVGEPKNTNADYYLKNTEEVAKFLQLILDLKA